ncbi:MAG: flavin reductase family protein [Opitutales bacterium]|nr:flavin reductase family protein [Opitutales bacterium]
MLFDLTDQHRAVAPKILSPIVAPRPVAWVTTIDAEGVVNAAPYSNFMLCGFNPPLIALAPGNKEDGTAKDTAVNIRKNQEFVINMLEESLLAAMHATARPTPYGVSELEGSGLKMVAGISVKVPRIADCPAAIECREHSTIEIGGNRLVVALIQRVWVRDGLFNPEDLSFDISAYSPIAHRISPAWYCRSNDVFEHKA